MVVKKLIGVISSVLACACAIPKAQADVNIPAPTPNWQFLGTTTQGDGYSIQVMRRQGQNVGYWQRIAYANPQPGGYTIQGVYGIGNCQQSTISILWIVRATNSGKLIAQGKSDNTKPIPVPVNSIGTTGLRSACGGNASNLQADIVKAQLESLTHARQTNAEMLNNTLNAVVNMFK